jgi:hypothetical protein
MAACARISSASQPAARHAAPFPARFVKKRLTFVSYPQPHVALDTLQVLFCAKIADLPASGRKA